MITFRMESRVRETGGGVVGGWESLRVAVHNTSRREVNRFVYLRQKEKIALHPHPRVTGVNGKNIMTPLLKM